MSFSYKEYMGAVWEMQEKYPNWRYGQVCFNTLYIMAPELANEIRSSSRDPFYKDEEDMTEFWDWLVLRMVQ